MGLPLYCDKIRLVIENHKSAKYNMAIDNAIYRAFCENKTSSPTLRIYRWENQSVSLGKFQAIECVKSEFCESQRISIVRRPTGGRAVIHLPTDLTYSFVGGAKVGFPENLRDTYLNICSAVTLGLKHAEIDANIGHQLKSKNTRKLCFLATSISDIEVEGKKIIGSAQCRDGSNFLQHGTIPFESSEQLIGEVFNFESAQEANLEKNYYIGQTTNLGVLLNDSLGYDFIIDSLIKGFEKHFSCKTVFSKLTDYEKELADLSIF